MHLNDYYGGEAEQYSFYRIPKALLTAPRYQSVSIEAKVLYSLLLERIGLSVKNGWIDNERRVCIHFTQADAMETMDCGYNKAVYLFTDLELTGLIEQQHQGRICIYVKNFLQPPPSEPELSCPT